MDGTRTTTFGFWSKFTTYQLNHRSYPFTYARLNSLAALLVLPKSLCDVKESFYAMVNWRSRVCLKNGFLGTEKTWLKLIKKLFENDKKALQRVHHLSFSKSFYHLPSNEALPVHHLNNKRNFPFKPALCQRLETESINRLVYTLKWGWKKLSWHIQLWRFQFVAHYPPNVFNT